MIPTRPRYVGRQRHDGCAPPILPSDLQAELEVEYPLERHPRLPTETGADTQPPHPQEADADVKHFLDWYASQVCAGTIAPVVPEPHLATRIADITQVKSTTRYALYLERVPRNQRVPDVHPVTPDPYQRIGFNQFRKQFRNWRKAVAHEAD